MNQIPNSSFAFCQPEVVLDIAQCKANIQKMMKISRQAGITFRPHFKTHQSRGVGRFFRQAGVKAITVSSVSMARYFAEDGWDDITIAFPINLREWEQIKGIASIAHLSLLISDETSLWKISELDFWNYPLNFFIELDTGHGRSGFRCSAEEIVPIIRLADENQISIKGFLFHDGHTYQTHNRDEIRKIRMATLTMTAHLRRDLEMYYPGRKFLYSIGDTPSCSIDNRYEGIDEMRPGNFIFYDLMQYYLGSCTQDEIAVRLVCPVVAVYPDQERAVIYGGAIHLGKDFLIGPDNKAYYGAVCFHGDFIQWQGQYPIAILSTLSQEHGVVKARRDFLEKIHAGDLLDIVPVHSCLMISAAQRMIGTDGTIFDTLSANFKMDL
jgi:D-serine deaminase-like pyridoxal phosphate-dependent protein